MENLAEALASVIRHPLRSPLDPEIILVQSQGMARWLKLQLAQKHGICCNYRFPFPRAFSYEAFATVLGDLPAENTYDPEVLIWEVMKTIPTFLDQHGFEAVKNYLGKEPDERKLYQLADRIANVFDQYLVFRPELIRQWEPGDDQGWQAKLWRLVSGPFRDCHPAALQFRFIEHLEKSGVPIAGLPERIAIFGVSALPPFYLRIFAALSRQVEVSLYLLQPCEQFWGYISSAREQEKTLKRAGKGASEADQLYLEQGNRLLASMGQLGRDFLLLLQDAGDWQEGGPSRFAPAGDKSLLSCIQTDILILDDNATGQGSKITIAETDDSVQIHSCHSPLRELEVLYDHLLEWFERAPELAPRDILVMIPDIELYAPYIQAVFGSPEQDSLRIPFSVADRTARTQSHLIDTFLLLLKLVDSRLGVSQVLTLLESAPIRLKFELDEDALELVRLWVEEVRIRWGQNEEQRAGLGLPAWAENTWRHGMERLLLGYAMAGDAGELFQGIRPYNDIEGKSSEVLGQLAEFLDRLFCAVEKLKVPRPLNQWSATFHSVMESLFETSEQEFLELQVLNGCFEKLASAVERAGFNQPVGLAVVLEQLNRDLSEDYFGSGYLTGGVTFCALKPMRSIPAKVICLLGMNDRSFPRTSPQLSFDLMTEKPQLGDRSSRADDRYLFLETLISARERLYLSYVGQSIKDNREAPPSVLVSELSDYVAQRYELPGRDIIEEHLLTRQRLQAFSTAYFQRGKLFSYSRENLKASQVVAPERKPPGNLVPKPLPQPEPEWLRLTLPTLAGFFCNPAKFLTEKRLGIRMLEAAAALEERETFEIAGLERYALHQELLEMKMAGVNLKETCNWARAAGRLPAGMAGDAHFAHICREVELFHTRLQPFNPGKVLRLAPFELAIGDFRLTGNFIHARPAGGLLFYRLASLKPKDLLRAWVEHVLFHATQPAGKGAETIVVATDSIIKFTPVTDPLPVLEQMLECYRLGLSEPLKFFPESSYAFAEADRQVATGASGKTTRTPIDFALTKWRGNDFFGGPGERQDQYMSLLFKDEDALAGDFEKHARSIFHPLLERLEEVEE